MTGRLRATARSLWLAAMFVEAGLELVLKRPRTRQGRADWLHRFCARAMRRLDVQVTVAGSFPGRGAVISNHLSYVDIIAFAALRRCVFVSKVEIESWPVVGWMTTMSGTVYVERGHGGSAKRARAGMQAAAEAGLPVVFFPEGTTSNGEGLLQFHSGLLAQAMAGGAPVTAAYIHYTLGAGNDPAATVEHDVCFWGDTPMLPHIFRFLSLRGVRAEVRFASGPIAFTSDVLHRKQAAREAQAAVAALAEELVAVQPGG